MDGWGRRIDRGGPQPPETMHGGYLEPIYRCEVRTTLFGGIYGNHETVQVRVGELLQQIRAGQPVLCIHCKQPLKADRRSRQSYTTRFVIQEDLW